MADEKNSIEFPDQKIVAKNMEQRVRTSFIEYAMSVITSRALPDVRDGMKPGQRRIMYAMHEDGLTYDKPFRKSATTVGNVLGRYHPHGDVAVYQTMVRMAQPFSYRYTLVEGHGNFGNVDGDGAAAYRYTEARMSKIADLMMSDIEKDVVPLVPNFDNSRKEPTVLPSRFPNILVNGSVGIAVGMATNIPPHNLSEVIDGTIYRIDNPECEVMELMNYIKGPDFPTRGIVYGFKGLVDAYTTGKGRVLVRARARIEEEKRRIIITEIPYMVNKSMLIESMANLVKDKKIEGISDLRDESGRAGMRIVVEYKKDANGEIILNQLYKNTQLQDTCAVNMLALVKGEPKILSLPEILDNYISFQEEIIVNRTKFDLEKALREMHILEGYKVAIDNIDAIVELIKKSESTADAKARLSEKYGLSDAQAQAIIEMPLGKLSGLERQKVEDRIAKLTATVADLRDILENEGRIKEILKEELLEIKNKFGDERRTELVESTDEIDIEDLIERHSCVITLTHTGYIKRQRTSVYSAQHRGGKGIIGMTTKEEDFVENVIVTNSHSTLLMFTNIGKVHAIKAYRIPEASRTAKGGNAVNLLALEQGEKITSIIEIDKFGEDELLTMVTKYGVIKRTLLSAYAYQRKGGKIAINLDDGDELLYVRRTVGDSELIIATRMGMSVRFDENNVRAMGRLARGVRGIRLDDGDEVVGVALVEDGKQLLTITENGFGKRCDYEKFRTMKNRGGKGVTCHKLSDKTGKLASVASVLETDDVMLITDQGTIIRTRVADIPVYSRTAGGVIVMRLADGAKISDFQRLTPEDEVDEKAAESEAQVAKENEENPIPQPVMEPEQPVEEPAEDGGEGI
ncbi:MAG: DNA gyrase subunit A [Clostridia bacterium]|nr:DNA gyrase subunit A [Clostridia bacterium]